MDEQYQRTKDIGVLIEKPGVVPGLFNKKLY